MKAPMDSFIIRTKLNYTPQKERKLLKECNLQELGKQPPIKFEQTSYASLSKGHQMARARNTSYWENRNKKLKEQRPNTAFQLFSGVVAYINGFTGKTKDIDLRRIIMKNGGEISYLFGARRCTHIITAMGLCGSKTHKYLTSRRNNIKIVKPEWIIESVAAGKRLHEARFRVVKDETQASLLDIIKNPATPKKKYDYHEQENR
ncbi:hypothetical protein G9A89_022326 [Geosiphon pyriformis]|nr:hypothetical protein G9A89_022326 [Geosiphon pyriformis]